MAPPAASPQQTLASDASSRRVAACRAHAGAAAGGGEDPRGHRRDVPAPRRGLEGGRGLLAAGARVIGDLYQIGLYQIGEACNCGFHMRRARARSRALCARRAGGARVRRFLTKLPSGGSDYSSSVTAGRGRGCGLRAESRRSDPTQLKQALQTPHLLYSLL